MPQRIEPIPPGMVTCTPARPQSARNASRTPREPSAGPNMALMQEGTYTATESAASSGRRGAPPPGRSAS
jgi:hypothetical protein